jgi:hypothetical protein
MYVLRVSRRTTTIIMSDLTIGVPQTFTWLRIGTGVRLL